MGFRDSMRELSGYFKEQRKEGAYRTRLVKDSIKDERKKKAYHNFKRALFEKLNVLFYEKEYSRVVLTPKDGDALDHFERLLTDTEFTQYYEGEFLASGDFSVTRITFDLY